MMILIHECMNVTVLGREDAENEEPEKVQGPIDSPVSDDGPRKMTYVRILTYEYNGENEHETEM